MLKGSLIIGQSGGPSSVINASAYGVIRTALDSDCITKVYGAYHGINLGKLFENLLLIALGKTAGHNDPFEGTIFFKPCDVKNVIDRFLLCGLYEGAGIDHNNIRVDILGDDLTSGFRKL